MGFPVKVHVKQGFPVGSNSKESIFNEGFLGLIPGLGRSSGEGNSYPLQYSCLENSMDRGAWQATVHGVTKSWTQLSNFQKKKKNVKHIGGIAQSYSKGISEKGLTLEMF